MVKVSDKVILGYIAITPLKTRKKEYDELKEIQHCNTSNHRRRRLGL